MLFEGVGVFAVISMLLVLLVSWFAYKFGRSQEKINYEKEKSEMSAYVRSLRCQLDDDRVVEQLHEMFKR